MSRLAHGARCGIGPGLQAVLLLSLIVVATSSACGGASTDASVNQPTSTPEPGVTTYSASPAPSSDASNATDDASGGSSGILVFQFGANDESVDLTLIDPDTGESTLWRQFDTASAGEDYELVDFPHVNVDVGDMNQMGTSLTRYVFSSDYGLAAVQTKIISSNGSRHVGWVSAEGEFVDVTASVNADQSDFADAPWDENPFFGRDGFFYWFDKNAGKFKRVSDADVEPGGAEVVTVQEAGAALGLADAKEDSDTDPQWYFRDVVYESEMGFYAPGSFSDWIDGKRYLAEDPVSVGVGTKTPDSEKPQLKSILPKTSRENWNPIASPDGERVVFLSRRPNEAGMILFVVPVAGGQPELIETDYDFMANASAASASGFNIGGRTRWILDWL
jgi:hypothetical protein